MRREKRAATVKSHIPYSLREQLELFAAEDNVLSMSDYLHRVLEEHVAIRIVKQQIGRKVGNQ